MVTQTGATARSCATRCRATASAVAGKSASAGPPQHQVRVRACSGSPTIRPVAASSRRGSSVIPSYLAYTQESWTTTHR